MPGEGRADRHPLPAPPNGCLDVGGSTGSRPNGLADGVMAAMVRTLPAAVGRSEVGRGSVDCEGPSLGVMVVSLCIR